MSNQVEFIHIVAVHTDATSAQALASQLRGMMTDHTYVVPLSSALRRVDVGSKVRVVLHLADGRAGLRIEGSVAVATVDRAIHLWRAGAMLEGLAAPLLANAPQQGDQTGDWEAIPVP